MQVRKLASSCLLFYTGCASLPLLLALDDTLLQSPVTELIRDKPKHSIGAPRNAPPISQSSPVVLSTLSRWCSMSGRDVSALGRVSPYRAASGRVEIDSLHRENTDQVRSLHVCLRQVRLVHFQLHPDHVHSYPQIRPRENHVSVHRQGNWKLHFSRSNRNVHSNRITIAIPISIRTLSSRSHAIFKKKNSIARETIVRSF